MAGEDIAAAAVGRARGPASGHAYMYNMHGMCHILNLNLNLVDLSRAACMAEVVNIILKICL
eukprot:SAG22_NODE_2677_length_2315_cov_1.796029_2_plen_62_part_00